MRMRLLVAALAFLSSVPAFAAPCAGFVDVDDADPNQGPFCPNVQWIRNRGVTLGCSIPNSYCPSDPVNRLQMAAFMNRLGNALQPEFVHASNQVVGPTVVSGGVACQTAPYVVTDFPRVATATATLIHAETGQQTVAARIVYSVNGGAWTNFSDILSYAANPAGSIVSQTLMTKAATFQPSQSVRFGIAVNPAPVTAAQCELQARLESRTGTSAPFDEGAAQ